MGIIAFITTVFYQVVPFLGGDAGSQTSLEFNVPVPQGISFKPFYPPELLDQHPIVKPNPEFTCHYPSLYGWELCNGPDSRSCWLRDVTAKQPIFSEFDINTDYEKIWPPGVTREYWLDVSETTISPDGFPKLAQVFNETYPGPLIEACWGDDIVIHVQNKLADNGTTIHWHGIRQLHTNDADGVNGITQCPIAQNRTYTYRFKALQYGHTWYHSHYSLQYPNGVAGPLLIHGPTSANWDIAWEPIFMNDWVHANAFSLFTRELVGPQLPTTDSVLLGGQGRFNDSGSIFTRTVPKAKRVLLRLVNTSIDTFFKFSIDGHNFTVISTDFVPIEPYETTNLSIAIGQRYSVIVETNQEPGNYWIRTDPMKGCAGNATGNVIDGRTGILRYEGAPPIEPTTTAHPNINYTCADEPSESLVPVVRWEVGSSPANNVTDSTFEVGLQPFLGANRWAIGEQPLYLNFSDPTLLSLSNKTFDPNYDVFEYDSVDKWNINITATSCMTSTNRGYVETVYLVITGNGPPIPDPPIDPTNRTTVRLGHPIHMHGHDFVILGRGEDTYNEATDPLTFNYHNPPRRDVAFLPIGGWLAIAFQSDNPGVWLLHCHIAWHASSGLALQILERKNEILADLGPERVHATEQVCLGWDSWLAHGELIDQEDSGI